MTNLWYPIMTLAKHELHAEEELELCGYQVYVPIITRMTRASGKSRRMVEEPYALFPRYVFVMNRIPWDQMNPEHPRCLWVGKRKLISGALKIGGGTPAIDEYALARIKENAALAQIAPVSDTLQKRLPAVGEVALITAGPFEGHAGQVAKMGSRDAQVALQILNAVRLVKVPVKNVERAA